MAMQMSRQHRSCTLSAQAEKLFECLRACDRHLAGKGAAYVGCGVPVHQTSILKDRDSGNTADAVGSIAAIR